MFIRSCIFGKLQGLLERNYAEAAARKAAPQGDYLFIPGNDCHSLQRLIGAHKQAGVQDRVLCQ
uniref:Uncharacterized protein n=1 Tax=Oryza glumipatula TaxID=40148 RepID=A0A0D9YNI2_9ORYZ